MMSEKELSPEEIKKKLEECQKKAEEYLAGWQRARADLLNYKKEEMERVSGILEYALQEFILKILPILDNFEIAEKKLPEKIKVDEQIKGLLQIKAQLQDFLKGQGIEEIKTVGKKFDPNFQEAVETIEKEGVESGTVLEEVQKGYMINGRLLRPARVKVAK